LDDDLNYRKSGATTEFHNYTRFATYVADIITDSRKPFRSVYRLETLDRAWAHRLTSCLTRLRSARPPGESRRVHRGMAPNSSEICEGSVILVGLL